MKLTTFGLALGLAVCAASSPATAWASDKKPSINRAQQREQVRIRQGIRSGELTRAEAARLQADQARIRVYERYNRADGGNFTPRERLRLQQELRQASRRIYHQKHDSQDRD